MLILLTLVLGCPGSYPELWFGEILMVLAFLNNYRGRWVEGALFEIAGFTGSALFMIVGLSIYQQGWLPVNPSLGMAAALLLI